MRLLLGLLSCARAFYVPGVAPIDFSKEEKVEIKGKDVHFNDFCFLYSGLKLTEFNESG